MTNKNPHFELICNPYFCSKVTYIQDWIVWIIHFLIPLANPKYSSNFAPSNTTIGREDSKSAEAVKRT